MTVQHLDWVTSSGWVVGNGMCERHRVAIVTGPEASGKSSLDHLLACHGLYFLYLLVLTAVLTHS